MAPTEFASRDPLPGAGGLRPALPEAVAARPRASTFPGEKAEKAAEKLGIETVGELLDHIPRDRRAARLIGELAMDEVATVVVAGALDHEPAGARGAG